MLLNFAHPLSQTGLDELSAAVGGPVREARVACDFDLSSPIGPQVSALFGAPPLAGLPFETLRLVVNPPGLASASAVVLAELHGRVGHFPVLLRLRPRGPVTEYVLAELLPLQAIRDTARRTRTPPPATEGDAGTA